MGVYINGMEMPDTCAKCRFCIAFECVASLKYIKDRYKRNDDCPLVEVKAPHGRLIDAKAFEVENVYFWGRDFISSEYDNTLENLMNNAPTIIEAEGKNDG